MLAAPCRLRDIIRRMNASADLHAGQPHSREVRRRTERAAADFGHADFVHRAAFEGLLARMKPMTIEPDVVLDLGCATGDGVEALGKRYRRSRIVGLDLAEPMTQQAARRGSMLRRHRAVQADARALPFGDNSLDLVVSNLLLPMLGDPEPVFREVGRVLRKDGVFAFATLGPDSLSEIRAAWQSVDDDWHVNLFADMHDIGDAMVRSGLRDPVLDVDFLDITYRNTDDLFRDLTSAGARNCLAGRRRSLTGKRRFAAMTAALRQQMVDGLLPLRLELVYGHAFGGGPRQPAGEFRVAPTAIGRRQHD